jgi:hypothetical protein
VDVSGVQQVVDQHVRQGITMQLRRLQTRNGDRKKKKDRTTITFRIRVQIS